MFSDLRSCFFLHSKALLHENKHRKEVEVVMKLFEFKVFDILALESKILFVHVKSQIFSAHLQRKIVVDACNYQCF